jgi:thiamine pyrophosphate-dependent acetolactate synthase large subunit-like protein
VLLALGLALGFAIGAALGEPSAGTLIGLGAGGLLALLLRLRR